MKNLSIKLLLSFLSILLIESSLRIFKIVPAPYPEQVEFGWPDPVVMKDIFQPDADLLWVPKNYFERLKAAPEVNDIVFMGDSCTEFGSYPQMALDKLNGALSRKLIGVNMGVGGWSTFQGRQQLHRDVIQLHPKAISIYYGWNDHWKAFGFTDEDIVRANQNTVLKRVLEHSKIASLVFLLAGEISKKGEKLVRVPPENFKSNLVDIIRTARANDISAILITAPSNHEHGLEPRYLWNRHLYPGDDLIALHQQYSDMVREVAKTEQTSLCDFAHGFNKENKSELFTIDGIHLSPKGDMLAADLLAQCLQGVLN